MEHTTAGRRVAAITDPIERVKECSAVLLNARATMNEVLAIRDAGLAEVRKIRPDWTRQRIAASTDCTPGVVVDALRGRS